MKFAIDRPLSNADVAARKLVEIAANTVEAVYGRIYTELVNAPFLTAAARRISTAPVWPARSHWAGSRFMTPGRT
jgi:hypothetical protein